MSTPNWDKPRNLRNTTLHHPDDRREVTPEEAGDSRFIESLYHPEFRNKPCKECPYTRFVGCKVGLEEGQHPNELHHDAVSEAPRLCHLPLFDEGTGSHFDLICIGALQYASNVAKMYRNKPLEEIRVMVGSDKIRVHTTPMELRAAHLTKEERLDEDLENML